MSHTCALHISIHEITSASLVLFAIAMMFNHLTPLSLSLSRFKNWITVRNKVWARTRIIDNQQADCLCNSCLNSTSCSETISMCFGKTPRLNKFLAAKISEHTICNNCRLKTKYSDQDAYWLPLCLVGYQVNSPWRKGKSSNNWRTDSYSIYSSAAAPCQSLSSSCISLMMAHWVHRSNFFATSLQKSEFGFVGAMLTMGSDLFLLLLRRSSIRGLLLRFFISLIRWCKFGYNSPST
jgi:hypothetical protein